MHAAIGPGRRFRVLVSEAGYEGTAVAAVCADTRAQALAAVAAIDVEWEVREPLLDPDEAVARESLIGEPRSPLRAATSNERWPRPTSCSPANTAPRSSSTARSRPTSRSAQWVGDTLEIHISTQYIWGVRDEVADELGLPRDKVRVICHYMGGGFGSKNDAGDYTFIAIELARRTGRPGPLRAVPPRGQRDRRQPQRDDPAPHDRRAQRRHHHRARRRVRERRGLGRAGRRRSTGR